MSTERFDKAAAGWDGKSRRVQLAGKISAAICELPLSKEMKAMEYGCGTGLVGLAVAPLVQSLSTIDSSKGMLEVLQEKCETQGIRNITTLCCDLLQDDYQEKHDLIFCAMTLHHIKDHKALLQRFCALLNPGGYLAVADLVSEDGSFHKADAEGIHHKGFEPKELEALLHDYAMEEVQHRIVYSIVKEEDNNKEFPVFLLTARKI
jgi:ubiquinone/menaquinone biosynthesis C-methylase UbiE